MCLSQIIVLSKLLSIYRADFWRRGYARPILHCGI